MQFKQPPILYNEQGQLRTVGFELEYANLGIEESVRLVQELYGGQVEKENRFKQHVRGTSLGDFTIEFDLTLLTEMRYKKAFAAFNIRLEDIRLGESALEEELENALESVIGKLFPYEIACPPVPCTQLEQIEKLREALHQHHAEGTEAFPTNAFGTHINIQAPNTNTETLLTYLKAFLLLYPLLIETGKTDLARKISPFIDPYPTAYVELVLSPDYRPNLDTFIEDYHTFNPDRNRPVDMYPMFSALKHDKLEQYTGLGKVKARKTFHYRLPNSSIANPNWTLAQEWNNWVMVEELANDPEKIAQLSREYLALKNSTLLGFESKWLKLLRQS
ncbi:putative amidoligase enzyme [Pontibacter ummariensis]|uniref:Putative amidoligase enzyme n=1 Tax=Pontibacter ummariensis TaxID=1610492 RepID=A0A239I206_9BACT|nr:amidoligase family protein [Pontibacter ummariensis]PRY10178.1 putative amidoligase enzyme [Pontibacter ummariensis]SNS87521.1 Putative amidoligase enzyme [Pontibacter ummariensis]